MRRSFALASVLALALAGGAASAPQTYPGKNGLIAYTKRTQPCIGGRCAESIWVSALDGSNAKRLTPVSRKDHERRYATWSPDGRRIAYVDNTGAFGMFELWVVNANGTGRKKLATAKVFRTGYNRRPTWTSDGKAVAFLMADSGSVLAIDVQTRKVRELFRLPRRTYAMQLSPNGKLVAFTKSDTGGWLFVRRIGGGTMRLVETSPAGWNDNFAWSPDSARLVFMTQYPYAPAIVSASGGPVRRLDSVVSDRNQRWNESDRPIFSPDGRTILWSAFSHAEPDPANPGRYHSVYDWDRFRTIDVDSGKVTVVGPGAGSCRIQIGGDPDTGKRPPPAPCPVSSPSWQPRN